MLGAGYSLNRAASLLKDHSVILASRNSGSYRVDAKDLDSLKNLFDKINNGFTVIDSIPPDYSISDPILANRNIASLLHNYPIERLIYLSSTSVYGGKNGDVVSEENVCQPETERGNLRLQAEELYKGHIFPTVILRLSGIYGPDRGVGILMKEGRYNPINIDRYTNRIHVDDIALVLSRIINNPPKKLSAYEIINLSDDLPEKIGIVWDYYKERFKFANTRKEINQSPSKREDQNQRVSNRKLKELFSPFNLKYPSYLEGAGTEFLINP